MFNNKEILETIEMINEQHLDVRTITMGISLIDCMDTDIYRSCEKVYNKIYKYANRRLLASAREVCRAEDAHSGRG